MIRVLLLQLSVISLSHTQFTCLVHSLTDTTTIQSLFQDGFAVNISAFGQDCTGLYIVLAQEGRFLNWFDPVLDEHEYLRISYKLACQYEEGHTNTVILEVAGDQVDSQTASPPDDNIMLRTCDFSGQNFSDMSNTVIVPHTSNFVFEIRWTNTVNTNNNLCYLYDIKIEHGFVEEETEVDPQDCFDNLGTLMDGEGNTLITNTCDTVNDGEHISFKFTTTFLEPYQYNEDCFELDVWFNETQLQQGDGEFNQWTYDGETQQLTWNIKLKEFTDLYNCIDGENEEQLYWICPFTTKLIFDGEVQLEYRSKIQVSVDRIFTDSIEIDIQKNVVEGVCCQNELQVQTEINFCDSFECDTFLEGPLTIERKEDFFVQVSILNPEFQDFYLKLVEVSLGEFVPVVVEQDSSVAGKLTLQLLSHVAKNDMILSVISQLHKDPIVPYMGTRRLLTADAQKRLENNQYQVISYENISIVNQIKSKPDSIQSKGIDTKSEIEKEEEIPEQQQYGTSSALISILAFASLGVLTLCLGLVLFFIKKTKSKKEKKEDLYLDSQESQLQKV